MDAEFWLNRWQKGETGFHRQEFHDSLTQHWPSLNLEQGSTVFVPLCGKSRDMVWLAQQGHKVIGIELSEIAIDSFFANENLEPAVRNVSTFTIKSAGPYELWCGDIFSMPHDALQDISAIYDRASLVAFPSKDQERYVEFLAANTSPLTKLLLISLHYGPTEMDGPPFSTSPERVRELFAKNFTIKDLERSSVLDKNENLKKRGLSWVEESTYVITPT